MQQSKGRSNSWFALAVVAAAMPVLTAARAPIAPVVTAAGLAMHPCGACIECELPGQIYFDRYTQNTGYISGSDGFCGYYHCQFCDLFMTVPGMTVPGSPGMTMPGSTEMLQERFRVVASQSRAGGAVASSDVVNLLVQYPAQLTLDVKRNALQARAGCDHSAVIGHIPLGAEVMAQVIGHLHDKLVLAGTETSLNPTNILGQSGMLFGGNGQ